MTTPPRLPNRPLRLVAVTLALAVAAGMVVTAEAAPPHAHGMGPGMDGPTLGAPAHMEVLLDQVGASAEQRSQVQAIMASARADMKVERDTVAGLRTQMMQLFTQPTVDARAVEALRQQMQARHDQTSKRMTLAMIEVSRVLSVEQRRQIGEQMNQRRSMMERHHGAGEVRGEPITR